VRRLPEGVLVAAIAALSAIAGTVVGGIVTYIGNERLQTHQVDQEEARQTTAARAVARILMSEYQADVGWIVIMTSGGEYEPTAYREHLFVSHIGAEDRKLLAGRLSEQDWLSVSAASRAIEDVQANLESHGGHGSIGAEERETLERARSACSSAYSALAPIAEGKAYS
jgi:hypothetical protein